MIVRGLLSNPQLLILDGTLDAMDIDSQEIVLNLLNENLPSLSVLLFTHEITLARALPKQYRIENHSLVAAFTERRTRDET